MGADLLPDSRTVDRRVTVPGPDGIEYTPIYCASCGKRYGLVPARLITHVTALCDTGCAGKYGDLAHHYVDADAKFRADAAEVVSGISKKLGRPVTLPELEKMIEEQGTSALAALARDWQARLSKEM